MNTFNFLFFKFRASQEPMSLLQENFARMMSSFFEAVSRGLPSAKFCVTDGSKDWAVG